ncbi:hypothetical protein ACI76W_08590 [Capnocytophaga canimorsus]|uniref:hypothetical protein n=1 Tax=Capnocytophaga canimorsus TaxID=28188 RepID=UPI00385F3C74
MWNLIKLLFYFFVAPYLVFVMIKVVAEDAPYLLIFFGILLVAWLLLKPIKKSKFVRGKM